jgi:hypothetical protein
MVSLWVTPEELNDPAHPRALEVCEAVTYALYNLSGQRFGGVQEVTEWYGRHGDSCFSCHAETYVTDNGHLFQPHGHRFFSGEVKGLRTRGTPIVSVDEIYTAKGLLDPTEYQIANRSVIYMTNRSGWNFSQGVTVTYQYGQFPPTLGRLAAHSLANEFLLSLDGDGECRLPDNVTSVSRQGLSFTLTSTASLAALRKTGIYEVDLFLATANPSGAVKKAKVFSPDRPRGEKYL